MFLIIEKKNIFILNILVKYAYEATFSYNLEGSKNSKLG